MAKKALSVKSSGYNYWKTIKKGLLYGAVALVTGLTVMWQDDVKYVALVPVLTMVLNWLKHRKK